MTTARKALTLLLSYLIFTKPLTEQHGSGLLLISMGIILKLLPDYNHNKSFKKKITFSTAIAKIGKPASIEVETTNKHVNVRQDEENMPLV